MNKTLNLTLLILFLSLTIMLTTPMQSSARTPNFIDQSDSFLSYSLRYEYSGGAFLPSDGSTSDETDLAQSMSTVQVSVRPSYFGQFYGIVGVERNILDSDVSDTTTEHGTVTGGGGQIVLDYTDDLYLKAVGSFYLHEDLDVNGANQDIEITQDWQGGFLLGRSVERTHMGDYEAFYNAYMGVLYSDRRAEITTAGTTQEYEMDEANGASVVAGLNWRYSRAVRLKFEGEVGAMSSGAVNLTYNF